MKSLFKYSFIFLAAFAATAAGTYIAVMLVASNSKEVVLPDLKGKNIIYVLETLTALDLNPKLYGNEYSKKHPRYHVISQDPEPGAIIKKGRDVVIYISKGEKQVNVPDLRHLLITDAKILIENKELKTGFISKTYSNDIAVNKIISQYPNRYSMVDRNSTIDLLISEGAKPKKYAMPDFFSRPLKDAKNMLNNLNLNISSIGSDYFLTMPQNVIARQVPEAGSIVTKETKIALVVNRKDRGHIIDPDILESVVVVNYSLGPGFLKKHVRITADLYGSQFNLVDKYAAGSENIYALVPGGIKTTIKIYIDDELVKTESINPWETGKNSGE
jgi:eukaryotic-like serine/threonine-protein kinase